MIKKIIILAVLPLLALAAIAQEKKECAAMTPRKGDFTVAVTAGYNSYTSVSALSGLQTNYEAAALSTNWSDKALMIGVEGGWFFKDLWKLSIGGGINFANNPGYTGVPGSVDASEEAGDGTLPNYRAVADASTFSYQVFAGVDRYFALKQAPRLMPYVGIRVEFNYCLNEKKYDEAETMGKSIGEAWNLRGALTCGADYYLLPTLYAGVQVDFFSYTYCMTTYKPQEGLANLSADSHSYSLLAAPTIKIGFKF